MPKKIGAAIAIIGAAYLVIIACTASWWFVPILVELGHRAPVDRMQIEGTAFFITWGVSGVLGSMIMAIGAALYASSGKLRVLHLTAGAVVLLLWLMLWGVSSHNAVIFGAGGSIILVCFLLFCLDWAKARPRAGALGTAADLRLASHVCFFIAAWGLCGLLGAPIFLLRPELRGAGFVGGSMAVKVLVCLVLGWLLTALAQRLERREQVKAGREALHS